MSLGVNNYNYANYLNLYKKSTSFNIGSDSNNLMSSLSSILSGKNNTSSIDYSSLSYLTGLKTGATSLKSSIKDITSASLLTQKSAVSSNTDSMTVSTDNSSKTATSTANSVKIEQLAAGQKNQGASLVSNDKISADEAGYRQIQIDVGGKSQQISFEVKAGDTNKDVQQKMADAINKAGIGVTASVNSDGNKSTLNIESTGTGTGTEGRFQIKDVAGNTVQKTGAGNIQREAQDAVYYLNDSTTAKTSKSNTVDIGGGVTATFKKSGDEEITVKKQTDTDSVVQKMKKFADSYNSLFSTVRDNDDSKGDKLFTKLISAGKAYANSLSKIGIGFDSGGNMTIDKDKMKKAAEDGSLEKFMKSSSGANYGYMSQLDKIANDVGNNTGKYVDKSAFAQMSVYSPYSTSTTARYNNIGMLFDMSF